eukprot:1437776-Pyramimonas_sp.AAC.1
MPRVYVLMPRVRVGRFCWGRLGSPTACAVNACKCRVSGSVDSHVRKVEGRRSVALEGQRRESSSLSNCAATP